MKQYRVYRLNASERIIEPSVEIEAVDDEAAVEQAIRADHAFILEVWQGGRLVRRVSPV